MNVVKPLFIGKRKSQRYVPVRHVSRESDSDSDVEIDLEKNSDSDSDSLDSPVLSSYSSSSVNSRRSMLHRVPSVSSVRLKEHASTRFDAYRYRGPRKFSRYFTLALFATLAFFILFLFHSSKSSQKSVEQAAGQKPNAPPPVWESFPFLKRYHGGIRTLVAPEANVPEYPKKDEEIAELMEKEAEEAKKLQGREKGSTVPESHVFDPYPKYSSEEYTSQYEAVQECFLDEKDTLRVPPMRNYHGIPKGMPYSVMGSYDLLGLQDNVCFERFGRLGPYGLGYSRKNGGSGAGMEGEKEGSEAVWSEVPEVDYRTVNWAKTQERCQKKNENRFKPKETVRTALYQEMGVSEDDAESEAFSTSAGRDHLNRTIIAEPTSATGKKLLPRTAVIIRTWHNYEYDDEDLFFLRALATELMLKTGGEYSLHFLVHVKDDNMPIWSDEATYQRVLNDSLPAEFRGMGTLWSERQMGLIYGGLAESFYRDLPVHGVYRSAFMPVQYFAHQHPEYDYFWHWEMDVRYTGHYYHFFDKVSSWAKKQPRKGLWERSSRFYVPSEHGSWDDFVHMVRVQTEHGTNSKSNKWAAGAANGPPSSKSTVQKAEKPIWGPERPQDDKLETFLDGETPPSAYKDDNYEWGVGEEADLIVFNPLFDPAGTNWLLADDTTGYNTTRSMVPRRAAVITASRMSKRLLSIMHRETALQRHAMFSEMWPATVSLHHGLKAVYAPHPVHVDRRWPPSYLAAIFNGGRNGATGGARTSVFSEDRQHNFRGVSWYYNSGFAPNLWRRWLGYKVDNDGGEVEELAGEGRMCLRAMLLHPVKESPLVYEHRAENDGDEQ